MLSYAPLPLDTFKGLLLYLQAEAYTQHSTASATESHPLVARTPIGATAARIGGTKRVAAREWAHRRVHVCVWKGRANSDQQLVHGGVRASARNSVTMDSLAFDLGFD